jgi:hypothetical protein
MKTNDKDTVGLSSQVSIGAFFSIAASVFNIYLKYKSTDNNMYVARFFYLKL